MSSRNLLSVRLGDDRKTEFETAVKAQGETMTSLTLAFVDAVINAHRAGRRVVLPIQFETKPAKKK